MVTVSDDEPRIAAWDRRVDWWLTGLAAVFLAAYAWQILDEGLGPGGEAALEAVMTVAWVIFGVDYLVRLALADNRWRYVRRHLLELLVLLLPMFRPLRALRVFTAIGVLNRQLRDDARGRVAVYVAGAVVLLGFVASLAVLDAERDAPDATLTTFGEAVWWTITTISTVGYGDRYPVTSEGRAVAAALMVAGIALLGVVTASIASWFVENLSRANREVERTVAAEAGRAEAQLAEVLDELRRVRTRLDELERDRRPS
ncbi:potassium channel family protein [Pseudonocardia lacus]|uniref:potassium channel family protein n=1 Tax=Pseudonocardia lacus TaxID=2835865 RepID=UPI001BDBEC38|nr:potassium channel family protein [Pseudonocardia lacus]